VTVASALAQSLNTIAAQLVMEAGPQNVIKFAHRMGIETDMQENASIALGTSEVSLVEMTSAYAPFMNGGYKATPHVIKRVTTVSGKVLYENTYDEPPRVISQKIAAQMNQMMAGVITRGTGKNAKLPGWQVAGKTGTTQSFRDALFVGYTANLVTGVWFGNDDGESMKKVTGGGLPSKAWSQFMVAAHQGLAPAPLFGLGTDTAPTLEVDAAPRTDPSQDTLFDMISHALGEDKADGKNAPRPGDVVPDERPADQVVLPPADVDEVIRRDQQAGNDDLVPPADVGETTGATENRGKANSTLLDVLMGD
jgi:penicillin-binding protein 1A